MPNRIISGSKIILDNGVFTTFNDDPSVLNLARGKEGFTIHIKFEEDSSNPKPMLKMDGHKDKNKNYVTVYITLINFNSNLYLGFTNPMSIGKFDNGDKVYIHINARRIGSEIKRHEISYTIYLEEDNR